MSFTPQICFEKSIARQVAGYTDLDLTATTGEYYQEYDFDGIGHSDGSRKFIRPAGSLYVEIDNWLVEVLRDMYSKVRTLEGLDMQYFRSNEEISYSLLTNGIELASLTTGDQGIDIASVQIKRNDSIYQAFPGDAFKLHNYKDPDSIYKALTSSPVYVVSHGRLYIYPIDATNTYHVEYLSAPNFGIFVSTLETVASEIPKDPQGSYTDDAAIYRTRVKTPSAICQLFASSFKDDNELASGSQYMPDTHLQGLVYGVSSRLLAKRMLDMQKKIPSLDDYSAIGDNALAEAEDSDGWQKVRYYIESEEDAELSQLKMSELNGQQQSWVLKYQWYGQQKQLVDSLYMGIFNAQQRGD